MTVALFLALRDLWHEKRLNICGILAYSAILTPLLILFGLKYGLLTSMTDRLLSDPLILEVIPVGAGQYDENWLAQAQSWPEVAFVIPKTRSIATSVSVKRTDTPVARSLNADLVPTGQGDPLLMRVAIEVPELGQAVISAELAQRLELSAGEAFHVIVRRVVNEQNETVIQSLEVAAVAPEEIFNRPAIWTDFEFLFAVEQYRDGYEVAQFGHAGKPAPSPRQPFSSFRMYATDLDAVVALRDKLRAQNVEARTQAARIASMLTLSRNVTLLFWVIATVATAGFVLAMGANLWASVERKTTALSIVHLMGGKRRHLTIFPITQAIVMTASAFIVSTILFLGISTLINWFYDAGSSGGDICYIPARNLLIVFAMASIVAGIAGLYPAMRIQRLEPTTGLKTNE